MRLTAKNLKIVSVGLMIVPMFANAQKGLDPALVSRTKKAVSVLLKDPNSAVFQNLYLGRPDNGSKVVCGGVNAKNSYGGFGGTSAFFYVDNPANPMAEIVTNVSPVYSGYCQNLAPPASAKDEAGVICGPDTNIRSPGECGQLYAACWLEGKDFYPNVQVKFMTQCRRKGVEAAMQLWKDGKL
jgi:hypothetical protein